ncbi:MAG TPA: hypothetical protein VHO48_04035 [Anaerolineaceae bacterium]|nr:hypothetical protein [Anaerolineaceae bacterium]
MKLLRLIDKRILWVGVVVVLVLLMMDFNNRMSELLRLEDERDKVSTDVGYLESTQDHLRTQIAYATSEVAVEEWARSEGHMAREGDVAVVPVSPLGFTPVPQITPAPTAKPVQNWEVWQALFFGP